QVALGAVERDDLQVVGSRHLRERGPADVGKPRGGRVRLLNLAVECRRGPGDWPDVLDGETAAVAVDHVNTAAGNGAGLVVGVDGGLEDGLVGEVVQFGGHDRDS